MPVAAAGHLHSNGWVSIDLGEDATIFLERIGAGWQPRAARRPGWQIEYPRWQGAFPETVRLRSTDPNVNVDLSAAVSQLEANIAVDPAAFTVAVPDETLSLTLEELRDAGPLRGE